MNAKIRRMDRTTSLYFGVVWTSVGEIQTSEFAGIFSLLRCISFCQVRHVFVVAWEHETMLLLNPCPLRFQFCRLPECVRCVARLHYLLGNHNNNLCAKLNCRQALHR